MVYLSLYKQSVWVGVVNYFVSNPNTWLTAKAGTLLWSWDSWLVEQEHEEQQHSGVNKNSFSARKEMAHKINVIFTEYLIFE